MAPELDAAEVARHNTADSCWVILYGKVYDVTSFLSEHPGGSKIILSLAGQDATEDYDPVHPAGALGMARAAARFGAMQIVSNNASMTPEQIVEGAPPGQLFGWQIYVQDGRDKSAAMLRRVNALPAHYKFVCLTLDAPTPGKREMDERGNLDKMVRVAAAGNPGVEQRPGGGGVGQQLFFGTAADLTWRTTLPWLAEHTDLPIVLKGVQTHEDAYLAMQHHPQVKAIILSNHGGRACDTAPPPIHTLLEIRKYCPEVLSRLEVWIDGGIRRGTDVVKALCLGARGVGVGRAPLYGLAAGGQAGVERMFEILQAEIATAMRLVGANSISDLRPSCINTRRVERDIYDGEAGLDRQGLWTKSKL
ncbi:hypothetical protein PWT90_09772 [Aphanocladium album]|nr:hypothetical protein PWT90_09772 [Aphanocladium album]